MKKYLVYYLKSLKTDFVYAPNFFFTQILDLVFFLTFFFLWKSVYQDSGIEIIAGYTLTSLITYYFATEFIFRFDVIGALYLNWDIWEGNFSNWIIKPARLTLLYMVDPIVEKTIAVLLALPIFALSYFIAKDYIQLPPLQIWGIFAVTLLLSFILNILFNLCLHALCFRFGDQENNIELANYVSWFMAGAFFPLAFVPGIMGTILNTLPFKYLMFVPANTFLGRYSLEQTVLGWLTMLIWIVILYFVFKLIYKNGLKYYTGVGR